MSILPKSVFARVFSLILLLGVTSSVVGQSTGEDRIKAEDFECIRDMSPVRGFFVDNYLGDLDATLEIANSTEGGVYPAGSIVQLVPGEVMVKHEAGFSPATRDWEFIEMDVTAEGASIRKRGFADVVNRFGGNCFACHIQARPEFDLVCEKDHGCEEIPLTDTMILAIQNTDPRCPPVELPAEQIEALKQLSSVMSPAEAE